MNPLPEFETHHESQSPKVGSPDHSNGASANNPGQSNRACQYCRASKVRCIQLDQTQPCVRCEKTGRQCLASAPQKRQKRTQPLSDYESGPATWSSSLPHQGINASAENEGPATMRPPASFAVSRRPASPGGSAISFLSSRYPDVDSSSSSAQTHTSSTKAASSRTSSSSIGARIGEIIDGDTASAIFEAFRTNMLPEFPFVAFPQSTSALDVWKDTPITFLSILDVAADGFCDVSVSRKLRRLLVSVYETISPGTANLSLPLLQAFIISACWSRAIQPTQPGEQLDVYQIILAASAMIILIGLGRALAAHSWNGLIPADVRRERGPASQFQVSTLEARRIWLGCHYVCSNTSMALQTPNVMRWTRHMDECLEVLEQSPASLPSDKALCHHCRLQHIVEEFELQLSTSVTSLATVRSAHQTFKEQLIAWASTPRAWTGPLGFSQHFVSLYMHEIVLSTAIADKATDSSTRGGPSPYKTSFSECVAAAHAVFDTFLSLDMSLIRALPTLYFVRLTHAANVLVKLYFAAANLPITEATQAMFDLRVDDYLGKMLQKFSGWGTLWPAWRLTKVFRKVREEFHQKQDRGARRVELSPSDSWSIGRSSSRPNAEISYGPQPAESASSLTTTDSKSVLAINTPSAVPATSVSDTSRDASTKRHDKPMPSANQQGVLPTIEFGDLTAWDPSQLDMTQLDEWLDTNMNNNTFDFGAI